MIYKKNANRTLFDQLKYLTREATILSSAIQQTTPTPFYDYRYYLWTILDEIRTEVLDIAIKNKFSEQDCHDIIYEFSHNPVSEDGLRKRNIFYRKHFCLDRDYNPEL